MSLCTIRGEWGLAKDKDTDSLTEKGAYFLQTVYSKPIESNIKSKDFYKSCSFSFDLSQVRRVQQSLVRGLGRENISLRAGVPLAFSVARLLP